MVQRRGAMVCWWCRLEGADEGDPLVLAARARRLGVQAWVVDAEAEPSGALTLPTGIGPLQAAAARGGLPFCLKLQLQTPLTPQAEDRLAQSLARWLLPPAAVQQGGRPVLLLASVNGFSHPRFGPLRLRLGLQRELRRQGCSAAPWLAGPAAPKGSEQAWDSALLWPCCNQGENYIRHLQRAHYGPLPAGGWPPGPWIPAVKPPGQQPGGTTELYGEWLEQAGALSRCHQDCNEEAVVLVQSWRDHQQWWPPTPAPDSDPSSPAGLSAPVASAPVHDHGTTALAPPAEQRWGTPHPAHLALLVHGFYPDRLAAFLEVVKPRDAAPPLPAIDLYVSTPQPQLELVATLLREQGWPQVRLFGVENRGRDLAPFLLQLLPSAMASGHSIFVKVHTKRSDHLSDGEAWSQHLLSSLLTPTALRGCGERLQRNPRLGLLAPAGTLLPCSVALHANAEHLVQLHRNIGVSPATLLQRRFIAGSMMAGRLEALAPVQQLGLQLEDFEPEQGQTDGTLAHALERWLCCAAAEQGWELEELPGEAQAVPAFGHGRPGRAVSGRAVSGGAVPSGAVSGRTPNLPAVP